MKTVILAGGLGTRLNEETDTKPKPMVEIGGKPILWHIMKLYSVFGIKEFIICLGYKGYIIKEYFANYFLHVSNVTYDLTKNDVQVHEHQAEPWKVTLIDTGDASMTGGRLKRVRPYLGEEDFCFTYGDGLGDIDMKKLIELHKSQGTLATLTAVQPPGRFGALKLDQEKVIGFQEKPQGDGGWVNGGFFVLSPQVIDYIDDDMTVWEQSPMRRLAENRELTAYFHNGFWQPMDTIREKNYLEELWRSGKAPWKTWNE